MIESLSNNKELNEIAKNEQNLWDDLSKKILHKISQGLQSPPQVDYNTSVDVRKASVEEVSLCSVLITSL